MAQLYFCTVLLYCFVAYCFYVFMFANIYIKICLIAFISDYMYEYVQRLTVTVM
jgi:hypothetical protein